MLNWIITFFVLAIIAGVLGFTNLAGAFAETARFLAWIFVALFIGSLVYQLLTGNRPPPTVIT